MTIGQHFTGGTAPAPRSGRPQVAVVGAGVAGLTSAYLLQRRYDVTLYEAQDRLGGHAHTHDIVSGDGRVLALDSGFLVHNTRTYPNLIRLFAELGVATRDTEMSMSVRCEGCGLEYAGSRGPLGLFRRWARSPGRSTWPPWPRSRASTGTHADCSALPAPNRSRWTSSCARAGTGATSSATSSSRWWPPSGHARRRTRWATRPGTCSSSSTITGCCGLPALPGWRTVTGGSRTYVDRIAKQLTTVAAGVPVRAIRRAPGGVDVHDCDGGTRHFARAVVATHPDEALRLLDSPTAAERDVLGAFRYTSSEVVLHTDAALLPRARRPGRRGTTCCVTARLRPRACMSATT